MKILRIVLIVAVLVGAYFLWRNLPGLRTQVTDTVDRYGGWTQEAREADPVGFIEFAEQKLGEDLVTFQESRVALADAEARGAEELERTRGLLSAARELAERFRAAFRVAEATGAYPANVAGQSYGRDELLDQVRLVLLQRDGYAETIARFEDVLQNVADREIDLLARIQTTKATLTNLKAQKELARIQKLTGEADDLLAKVDDLLGNNRTVAQELDSPVRTVEELLAGGAEAAPEAPGDVDVLGYLKDE